jgi:hypothetical protein
MAHAIADVVAIGTPHKFKGVLRGASRGENSRREAARNVTFSLNLAITLNLVKWCCIDVPFQKNMPLKMKNAPLSSENAGAHIYTDDARHHVRAVSAAPCYGCSEVKERSSPPPACFERGESCSQVLSSRSCASPSEVTTAFVHLSEPGHHGWGLGLRVKPSDDTSSPTNQVFALAINSEALLTASYPNTLNLKT